LAGIDIPSEPRGAHLPKPGDDAFPSLVTERNLQGFFLTSLNTDRTEVPLLTENFGDRFLESRVGNGDLRMASRSGISDPGKKIGDWIVHGIFGLPAGLGDARDQTVQCGFPEGEARDAILAYERMPPAAELAAVYKTHRTCVPRQTGQGLVVALGLQFCA